MLSRTRGGCRTAILATALLLVASCDRGPARPPNVLFVLIDTLRADRLGVYGNARGLTPFLDELAGRGAVFTNVYAPSSWTVPSIASLFTSRYASQHHVNTYDAKLADDEVTLAERLAAGGYSLAGFSANFRLTRELGCAQGFATWQTFVNSPDSPRKARGKVLRSAVKRFFATEVKRQPDDPRLLYLQYMEPHAPYEPAAPFRERFASPNAARVDVVAANQKMIDIKFNQVSAEEAAVLESLYDGEVASVDAELRQLFAELERAGFLDHAVVVVTADHGEEFREHGGLGHGRTLFNDNIRVPLIVAGAGIAGGRVVKENVSLLDVAPTLLELAGLPREARFEGRSLVPLLKPSWLSAVLASGDGRAGTADIVSELFENGAKMDLRLHRQALVRGQVKLLVPLRAGPEVYDLAADPGERTPNPPLLAAQSPVLGDVLRVTLASLGERAGAQRETAPVDEATKEKLRALGYKF